MSFEYEPSSELLHISAKKLFSNRKPYLSLRYLSPEIRGVDRVGAAVREHERGAGAQREVALYSWPTLNA